MLREKESSPLSEMHVEASQSEQFGREFGGPVSSIIKSGFTVWKLILGSYI